MKKSRWVCLVSAALLLLATPALASIAVRVVDKAGNPVPGVDLIAYAPEGWVLAKMGAQESNLYSIPGFVGDKVSFDVGNATLGWHFGIEKTAGVGGITIVLAAAPPANDLCTAATPVAVGGMASGTTIEATLDPEAPTCVVSVTAPGVWHTVTGTGTALTLGLNNSNYDTKLNVYCGDCGSLTCITGDDDSGAGLTSQLTFCSQPGVDYNVLVHGFGSGVGNYELTVTDTGTGCTPTVNCVPTGACCNCLNPPFNCGELTEAECAAQGSDYLGDDTACLSVGADLPEFVSTPGLPINDNVTIADSIVVADDVAIGDVDVDLIITHTWVSDLDITLTGPDGTAVPIWFDACGSNDGINAIFDDEGNTVLCGFPTTGVIDPTSTGGGDLGAFENTSSAGEWTLSVFDDAGGDVGTLVQWSLHIAPGVSTCPGPPVCGNGVIEEGEDCDDSNTTDGDGCSATCQTECVATDDETYDEDTDESSDSWWPGH